MTEDADAPDRDGEADDEQVAAQVAREETEGETPDSPETAEHAGEAGEADEGASLSDRVRDHDEDLAGEVSDLEARVEKLESAIEQLDAEREEYAERAEDLESRLKHKQADFQNYKKRAKKRQEQIQKRATESLVERLLDVRDNLKRALGEDSDDAEALREGVRMTLNEFDRVLDAENVREIDPDPGTETDPQRHEVMLQVESDQPEGTVAQVHRPGYEMADKVLRAAQVTVSDGSGSETGDDESADETDDGSADETDDGPADETDDGGAVEPESESGDEGSRTQPGVGSDERGPDAAGADGNGIETAPDDESSSTTATDGERESRRDDAGGQRGSRPGEADRESGTGSAGNGSDEGH